MQLHPAVHEVESWMGRDLHEGLHFVLGQGNVPRRAFAAIATGCDELVEVGLHEIEDERNRAEAVRVPEHRRQSVLLGNLALQLT